MNNEKSMKNMPAWRSPLVKAWDAAREIDRLAAENKRYKQLINRYNICVTCGKQLSEAEAKSVHTCYVKQALKGESDE